MAARRADPSKLHKNAVPALGLFVVLACASPASASKNLPSDCAELEDAGLQVPVIKLAAATIGETRATEPNSPALSTQPINTAATAPILDAPTKSLSTQGLFESRTPVVEAVPGDDTQSNMTQERQPTDRLPDIQTRFPGVSSVELKRFKRQMFRRDI
jgi:hypothetical protein